jgi:hypothetical protein
MEAQLQRMRCPLLYCGGKRMYASVLLIALTGPLTLNTSKEPVWLNDYAAACKQSQKLGKPLALFVGSGSAGWNRMSRDGQLSEDTAEILAKKYVCIYVDTNRNEGHELAVALEMPNHLGIVISDSTGTYQAFRHEGDLRAQDLNRYLHRYSDPQRVVTTTESNPGDDPPPRYYRPQYSVTPASYSTYSVGRSC